MDQDGYLDQKEIQKACKETGYSDNYDEIRATLKDVSTNASGKIDVEEFIEVSFLFSGKLVLLRGMLLYAFCYLGYDVFLCIKHDTIGISINDTNDGICQVV